MAAETQRLPLTGTGRLNRTSAGKRESENDDSDDPDSAVDLLGNGKLIAEQEKNLTEDEKRKPIGLVGQSDSF